MRKKGTQVEVERTEGLSRVVETPVFIPYTKASRLIKRLQDVDNSLGGVVNNSVLRFVEICEGGTIMDVW